MTDSNEGGHEMHDAIPHTPDSDVHRYSANGITIEWRPSLCQHSGRCVAGLPDVFQPKRRPWIEIGATSADAVEQSVARCPSGALRTTRP